MDEAELAAQVDEAMAELCLHCGKPPEGDGDHNCPCPYSDEECHHHRT